VAWTATQGLLSPILSALARVTLLLEGGQPPSSKGGTPQAARYSGVPYTPSLPPRVVMRHGAKYIIPSTSPYFSNPALLFEQYESRPKPKPSSHPPSSSSSLPPPSINPFDGMEVEEVSPAERVIIPTRYKHKPKRTHPDPGTTRSIPTQASPVTKSKEVQTSDSFPWNWNGEGTATCSTQTEPLAAAILASERFSRATEQRQPITTTKDKPTPRQDTKRKKQTDTSESDSLPHKLNRTLTDEDEDDSLPPAGQSIVELLTSIYPNRDDSDSDYIDGSDSSPDPNSD